MDVLWDVAPFNLVDIDRRFGSAYRLHHQGDPLISTRFHGAVSQKASILINVAVKTRNFAQNCVIQHRPLSARESCHLAGKQAFY